MFFLAIPALLETIIVVAASTVAAKASSDLYDKITQSDESNDD